MVKKLITSALPYVNNEPHLGNIIGSVLSADVYARFCRLQKYETLYICGNDEYGTATETKALAANMTPKEICDHFHSVHKSVYQLFNISFDFFGRTTSPIHTEIVQSFFKSLDKQGMIFEQETQQMYCNVDSMYLADRYVLGTCPHCGYDAARGDQCDQCSKLLTPLELKEPLCSICQNPPVKKQTKHLYLDLPKLQEQLRSLLAKGETTSKWSANAVKTTQGWLDHKLKPRPITRDLKWGVPVPKEGYENKVFYVWFDAVLGYISMTKEYLPDHWKDWWQPKETTQLYQFMAKDNIPFHTIIFPAIQMASKENWTTLHHINSTEYLNYENQKFSKSQGRGIFGTDVKNIGLPIDLWRFYLLFNRPEKSDSQFYWETFVEDINSNFIDNIGNLLNRILVFFKKYFAQEALAFSFSQEQQDFLNEVKEDTKQVVNLFEEVRLREALQAILALGRKGNGFFQEQKPWEQIKQDVSLAKATVMTLASALYNIGILLAPYMPETSESILAFFNKKEVSFADLNQWDTLYNTTWEEPQILYPKLDKKTILSYKDKFDGEKETEQGNAWEEVEIRVGEIKEITRHPNADKLFVEKIDLGEQEMRTVVSGLVDFYTAEELIGKRVLVVANLAPAMLRKVKSEGMLLTAEKGDVVEVLEPNAPIGSLLTLEGESDKNDASKQITIDRFCEIPFAIKDFKLTMDTQVCHIEGQAVTTQTVKQGEVR